MPLQDTTARDRALSEKCRLRNQAIPRPPRRAGFVTYAAGPQPDSIICSRRYSPRLFRTQRQMALQLTPGVPIRISAGNESAIRRFQLVPDIVQLVYIVIIELDPQAAVRTELDQAFRIVRRRHVEAVFIDALINGSAIGSSPYAQSLTRGTLATTHPDPGPCT